MTRAGGYKILNPFFNHVPAYAFWDKMRLWQATRPVLQKLAVLSALRQQLIGVQCQLQQLITQQEDFIDRGPLQAVEQNLPASLKAINAELKAANDHSSMLLHLHWYGVTLHR